MERFLEFTAGHPVLVLLLMASFFLLIFTEMRRKAMGLISVEPSAAVGLINNDAVVLDLRNAEAFARGHIVNAKNIPYDEFDAASNRITRFRDRPVVAVCDSGVSSNKVVDALRKSGFEKSYGLKGGMAAWNQAGLPVVSNKKTRTKNKA